MADVKNSSASPVHILPPKANPPTGTAPSGKPAPQVKPVSGVNPAKPMPKPLPRAVNFSTVPFWGGITMSAIWVGIVLLVLLQSGSGQTFAGLPLVNWALGITAVTAPIGLIWMVSAYLQRAADVQSVAEPLRRQLLMITGESGLAEQRIRRFNQVIRDQLTLLRETRAMNQDDLAAIIERLQRHKEDLNQFEQIGMSHVHEIQEIVQRSMQHIERVMEDKFTMLRVLDGKLNQSSGVVAQQTDALREQLGTLLQEIEANSNLISISLERAMQDSRKLSDTARAQEASIVSAADTAAETLGELSGKIDLNIARFLERASSSREEAERLANALDTQTRSLDEFTAVLPSRVGEAEAVLRGVADRLYNSEQLAREQTIQLSEKLSAQVESLQQMLDKFSDRFTGIDGTLQQRRGDLDSLVARIGTASDELAHQLEASIRGLGDRADDSLEHFRAVNLEAHRGAEEVSSQLKETVAHYEAAATKLQGVSESSRAQMKELLGGIGSQLSQFETLQRAAHKAGEEVQARAAGAMQNLQSVLERLLASRDAAQIVGENLTEKLRSAVDENETLIIRINEAAQMSVRALGMATESLGREENELAGQTRVAEATLREAMAQLEAQAHMAEQTMRTQSMNLTSLLREATDSVDATEKRLEDFATRSVQPVRKAMEQIDEHTTDGLDALGRYSDTMQDKLSALRAFNAQVSDMGGEVAQSTSIALDKIEAINTRFQSLRTEQEETARKTIEEFNRVAERLQEQVGSFDGQTSQAVKLLQDSVQRVTDQSHILLSDAQDSSSKLQLVTGALQNEAVQTRAVLQKQADDLAADLARTEHQFATLGESLKQKTDAAYAMIDRVTSHYNDMTKQSSEDFEARTSALEGAASLANDKVEGLNAALRQQLTLIGTGTSQLEANVGQIVNAGSKTMEQLNALNEKFVSTQDSTRTSAQETMARLEDINSAFMRQHTTLTDTAQNAVSSIQKAGNAFGEQASKMLDTTNQTEQQIRSLGATTTALADQAGQIRLTMDQQCQSMMSGLTEAVAQMDMASSKLQQAVASATLGADQAGERFSAMVQGASLKLGDSSRGLTDIAEKTEGALDRLGSNIVQQTASLNLISEQIIEQNRTMSASNENQRTQLVSIFEKIGASHAQASELAERSIARLGESLQRIQQQITALDNQSQSALGNVRTASGGFADQAGLLLQHAQSAEQQARTVLSVTGALQEQAKQLRDSLQQEGERTNELLGTLLSKLATGSTELRDLGTTAESTLTSLQTTVNQQTAGFANTMQQIGERQRSLTTALDAQRDVLNGLLCRLTLAQDETASSAERSVARLTESAQQISKHIETIDSQSQSALANVRSASLGFADEAEKFQKNAEETEQSARNMLSVATTLQEQARQMREGLHTESERTSALLSDLLGRITAGGIDLRDLSGSTTTSLASLQQQVSEQVSSLTTAMQQISERQRALSTALDTQRDSLNNVLNRVTLAQDETAATTERSVARLTDSTKQIAKQIETIEGQAQNTLASVRTVSGSLADETGTLQLQAQQAEQQLRNMLTIASGLQDQARQVREAMSEEAGRIISSIGSVTAQLDNSTNQLKLQGSAAVHSFEEASSQLQSTVQSGCGILQQQADNLKDMASHVETNIMGAGDKIRDHLRLVGEAGEQADQKARQLSDTIDQATSRLSMLQKSLSSCDAEGRELLTTASERIEEAKTKLYGELQHIAEVSDTAVKLIQAAGGTLVIHSDELRSNLSSSESAVIEAANTLREEGKALPTVLNRGVDQIEKANEALKAQASSASDTLVKTADRFIAVDGSIRDIMMEEMHDLDNVTTTAEQALRSFTQALTEQLAAMQNGSGVLATEQQTLVAAAHQTLGQLTAANDRLNTLHREAADTTDQLSRAFAHIDQQADATDKKLTQLAGNLTQQIDQLSQVTDRAETQIVGASQSFRDQLERVRAGVQAQIDDINRGLMQITAQLERTGTSLRTVTSATVSDIEKIGDRFEQTSTEAATQLTDRTARMRVATEEVAKLLNGFGDQLDVLLDRLSMAGDGLKRHESDLVGQLQTALTQLGSVAERLEANRLLTSNVSDQAVSRLAEVSRVIEKQVQGLSTDSESVVGIVRGVGRMYDEQAETLNRGVSDAQSQVLAMEQTIDSLQQRTDRMRVSLKLQGDELINSLEQILKQLATAGDIMGDTVDDMTTRQYNGGQRVV